jgi:hypothetical protein
VRATLSLGDETLRVSYLASVARSWEPGVLAAALDDLCAQAEQGEAASREVLVAVVDALNGEGMGDVLDHLREQASQGSLLALERLVRRFAAELRAPTPHEAGQQVQRVPEDGRGRPLTLGERKWLARRPDRETMQRLLSDPHPDVIARLLRNPRITEDDVVRLAAKRPGNQAVLTEIARSTKWLHRPRVRIALVMNPATPLDVAARATRLLLRSELELAAGSPSLAAGIRALCIDHLARRPPLRGAAPPEVH